MSLTFPVGVPAGSQFIGANGVTYVFDGTKWTGYPAVALSSATSGFYNNGYTAQMDVRGNLNLPLYTFPVNTGTSGQILTWPEIGSTLQWLTPTSISSGTTATSSYLRKVELIASLNDDASFSIPGKLNFTSGNYISNLPSQMKITVDDDFNPTASFRNTSTVTTSIGFFNTSSGLTGISNGWIVNGNLFDVINSTVTNIVNIGTNYVITISPGVFTPNNFYYFRQPSIPYEWKFGSSGNLTLPQGGVITSDGVAAVIVKAPSGSQAVLANNAGYNAILAQDQDVRVATSPDAGSTFNTWNFGTNGSLTFPDASVQTTAYTGTSLGNFAFSGDTLSNTRSDASTLQVGGNNWIFGSSGQITFPDTTVQTTAFTGTVAYSNVTGTPTTATNSTLGTIKIGSGIAITPDGTASVTAGSGLSSRVTASITTVSLAPGAKTTATIVGFKSYALLSIESSTGSWVTVYSSTATKTADWNRSITVDPTPGSGVVAEAISTQLGKVLFTPAVMGFSSEATPTTDIPVKIYNNTTVTAAITVTLTLLKLES